MTGVSLTRDEFIRQYLAIDTTSPTGLRWIGHPSKKYNKRFTGRPAGGLISGGYYQTCIKGCRLLNHRIIWFLHTGNWPVHEIDHIDGNPANNSPDNLRDVTHSENEQNKPARGYTWVAQAQRWQVYIMVNGRNRTIGRFITEAEARAAYLAAKAKYHPTAPGRCFD